ncbi:hypothetical protein TCDM_06740 [Trypanosoma cruzi Dm28c]|uniref:Uncharacterized protein n=1 Tax=Trypanosoma cruzi Dm28c TaxID=1416333 RepID=V5BG24_TRYCR|nr:hypothetical protein TCDM_06740 [Trypanosoma cruzi Dm28c]
MKQNAVTPSCCKFTLFLWGSVGEKTSSLAHIFFCCCCLGGGVEIFCLFLLLFVVALVCVCLFGEGSGHVCCCRVRPPPNATGAMGR